MDNKRLYKYDDENLELKPISKIVSYFILNPSIITNIVLIVVLVISSLFLGAKIDKEKEIEIRDQEIKKLKEELKMGKEFDTLMVRIGEAALEGNKDLPINDSLVFEYIKSCTAWFPEVIMAQYKIESASGKSEVAINAKNLFGMRPVSGKRINSTTQRRNTHYKGYAIYDNWKLSVIDKILWEHFRFGREKPNREKYLNSHTNYAENPNYIATIDKISQKYRKK